MNTVAIVAIVAMLFGLLAWSGARNSTTPGGAFVKVPPTTTQEVILYIDPPPARVMLNLSLPDRNPRR